MDVDNGNRLVVVCSTSPPIMVEASNIRLYAHQPMVSPSSSRHPGPRIIVCSELGQGTTGFSGKYCFGVMYGEWYGDCDFVVLSVVEVCVDYGGVNVFHVCLDVCVVYSVGVCVNVYAVVCVGVCCLFFTPGCCLLCCSGAWGVVILVYL